MAPLFIVLLLATLRPPTVEDGLTAFDLGNYAMSEQLLSEARASNPEHFDLNNLSYVQGRIAERQENWDRADREFARIPTDSVLYPMALWHRARAALEAGRAEDAVSLLDRLPSGFPADRLIELARGLPAPAALRIYDRLSTREAAWARTSLRGDTAGMWLLLAQNQTDDIALEAALEIHARGTGEVEAERRMLLARTFYAHREFDRAASHYESLIDHTALGPEAHYQWARTRFQLNQYATAVELFRQTAARHPETDWERDAEIQIAAAYWRQLDFTSAADAYLTLIEKYDDRNLFQSSVRDLVDIYRSLGDTEQALEWVARGLRGRPTATQRAVLQFSRAKINLHNGRFETALEDLRQLREMRLRSAPNGTNADEVRFLQARALEAMGRLEEARAIWTELGKNPFSYYGLNALARMDDSGDAAAFQRRVWEAMDNPSPLLCRRGNQDSVVSTIRGRRLSRTRGFRGPDDAENDLVGELVFLRQWDEAFYWANRAASRWRDDALADLAFLASDFRRAILYGDRLRTADDGLFLSLDGNYDEEARLLMTLLYPAAFSDAVCREVERTGVDPLWLRSIIWQESRYDASARSVAAARGLMQFIPETATEVADRLELGPMNPDRLYDPQTSIQLGAGYWKELTETLGSPEFALAAYNGGPHNVRRWMAKMGSSDDAVLFVSEIGFVQSKEYVISIFGLYARYLHLQ